MADIKPVTHASWHRKVHRLREPRDLGSHDLGVTMCQLPVRKLNGLSYYRNYDEGRRGFCQNCLRNIRNIELTPSPILTAQRFIDI